MILPAVHCDAAIYRCTHRLPRQITLNMVRFKILNIVIRKNDTDENPYNFNLKK